MNGCETSSGRVGRNPTLQSLPINIIEQTLCFLRFSEVFQVGALLCKAWERLARVTSSSDVEFLNSWIRRSGKNSSESATQELLCILKRFAHLRDLKLQDLSPQSTLTVLSTLRSLQMLECCSCFAPSQAKCLMGLTHLKVLSVKFTEEKCDSQDSYPIPLLPDLPALEELELSGCPHPVICSVESASLKSIKKLHIRFHAYAVCNQSTLSAFVAMVSNMTAVTSVAFVEHPTSYSKISKTLSELFLQNSPSAPHLMSLDLDVMNESMASLIKCSSPCLEHLSVRNIFLGTGNGEENAKLFASSIPNIKSIYVRQMWFGGLSQIKEIKSCPRLESLTVVWFSTMCCKSFTDLRCELKDFAYFRRSGNCGLTLQVNREDIKKEHVNSAAEKFLLEMCSFDGRPVLKHSQHAVRKVWNHYWRNEMSEHTKRMYESDIYKRYANV